MNKPKRNLTSEFKFRVILEALKEQKSQTELSREYNIHPQLIINWKRLFLREASKIFIPKREEKHKDRRIEELEKLIGRQTIEIQFLKKVLGHLD